jgi:integral membrane protein
LNFRTALARLRLIGFIEGTSAVLFCVAMPWKYLIDEPTGKHVVYAVGMTHGILWTLYIAAVLNAAIVRKWGIGRVVVAGLASIPPFATFIFDRSLRREQRDEIPKRDPV